MFYTELAQLVHSVHAATYDYAYGNAGVEPTNATLRQIAQLHKLPEQAIMDLHEDILVDL